MISSSFFRAESVVFVGGSRLESHVYVFIIFVRAVRLNHVLCHDDSFQSTANQENLVNNILGFLL